VAPRPSELHAQVVGRRERPRVALDRGSVVLDGRIPVVRAVGHEAGRHQERRVHRVDGKCLLDAHLSLLHPSGRQLGDRAVAVQALLTQPDGRRRRRPLLVEVPEHLLCGVVVLESGLEVAPLRLRVREQCARMEGEGGELFVVPKRFLALVRRPLLRLRLHPAQRLEGLLFPTRTEQGRGVPEGEFLDPEAVVPLVLTGPPHRGCEAGC
jgi:hypothetical protein